MFRIHSLRLTLRIAPHLESLLDDGEGLGGLRVFWIDGPASRTFPRRAGLVPRAPRPFPRLDRSAAPAPTRPLPPHKSWRRGGPARPGPRSLDTTGRTPFAHRPRGRPEPRGAPRARYAPSARSTSAARHHEGRNSCRGSRCSQHQGDRPRRRRLPSGRRPPPRYQAHTPSLLDHVLGQLQAALTQRHHQCVPASADRIHLVGVAAG